MLCYVSRCWGVYVATKPSWGLFHKWPSLWGNALWAVFIKGTPGRSWCLPAYPENHKCFDWHVALTIPTWPSYSLYYNYILHFYSSVIVTLLRATHIDLQQCIQWKFILLEIHEFHISNSQPPYLIVDSNFTQFRKLFSIPRLCLHF